MENLVGQYNGKGIYFFSGEIHQLYSDIELLRPYFVCVVFLHTKNWAEEELRKLIDRLMSHGAAYFVFHGNRCERAHDIADETHARIIPESEVTYDNVIGTDWFEDFSADEVIFSAFCGSVPADEYLDQFSSFVVISIGNDTENALILHLLTNVQSTIDMAISRPKTSSSH